jgi:nucleotide-binding universal stress UspA family protein
MYEKILVAVDHSEVSERALAAARELALLSHGEVWVVHLREREAMGKTGLLTSTESSDEATDAVTAAVAGLTQAGSRRTPWSATPCSAMRHGRSSATRPGSAPT